MRSPTTNLKPSPFSNNALLSHAVAAWLKLPESVENRHLHRAAASFKAGHFHIITDTKGHPYLIRFWLTIPFPSKDSVSPFESGSSHLLHWILKPDPDRHLHDHPWQFTSEVLSGGYIEETSDPVTKFVTCLPCMKRTFDINSHHRITTVLGTAVNFDDGTGGTWTNVRTGPRCRPWGFLLPSGWVNYATYFGQQLGIPLHE